MRGESDIDLRLPVVKKKDDAADKEKPTSYAIAQHALSLFTQKPSGKSLNVRVELATLFLNSHLIEIL